MRRQQQVTTWLHHQLPGAAFTLAAASADASFRRYFRATCADGRTFIVMDAPPQHEDCRPFLHIAKLFEQAGTHVPHIYAQDLEQGFLLLSDLGNTTYLQALCAGHAGTAHELYDAATDALIKIQLASCENELPHYDEALLLREMRLFPEWYITRHLGITLGEKQSAALEECFRRILRNNLAQPRVYVHRDYHSRNLMYIESPLSNSLPMPSPQSSPASGRGGKRERQSSIPAGERTNEKGNFQTSPGILDFQDAVYGPITYDLASLFKDAYIRWEEAEIMDWLIRYWEKARKAGLPVRKDFGDFYRDYEWMGVQRHLKVLGIFARLYHRDGKENYLKDMPLVMDYLRRACARYIDLKRLLNLLDELEPQKNQVGYTF
ncbi:MAG TPA: phosphotransferase [Gallionella sp.]|jgi:aminoglycoside/choline kinase family phosphotransferase|nr:phosphotransferase [Gallionella sp.]